MKTERELIQYALEHGSVCIGSKDGRGVFVSSAALCHLGLRECKERAGLTKRWPVRTDLSGNVVMVEGETHEDAINRYLNRVEK